MFQRVTLKKFSIAPIDGNRIILIFSASFFPNQDEIAKLADSVLEDIRIVVEQESLFDDGEGVAKAVTHLDDLARKHQATLTISGGGQTIAVFGSNSTNE